MTAERAFAVLWLLFSLAMAWMANGFEVAFAYEPVGPKAWPLALATMMALASLVMLLRPDPAARLPATPVLARVGLLIVALFVYAWVFQWLGFPLATALMTVAVGRLFGGRWAGCLLAGVAMGVGLYLFFDRLLDVVLPLGRVFR
ncbi:MAG: tripartite tricarboxylate transporter TctB family protein [Burkholderiaceae bacterium]